MAGKFMAEGDVEKAISICEKGLEVYPHYQEARLILGEAYLTKGMFAEARGKLEEVLKWDGENLRALQGLLEIAQREEDMERALQLSQKILQIEPSHRKAKIFLEEYEAKQVSEPQEPLAEEKPIIEPPPLEPIEAPPEEGEKAAEGVAEGRPLEIPAEEEVVPEPLQLEEEEVPPPEGEEEAMEAPPKGGMEPPAAPPREGPAEEEKPPEEAGIAEEKPEIPPSEGEFPPPEAAEPEAVPSTGPREAPPPQPEVVAPLKEEKPLGEEGLPQKEEEVETPVQEEPSSVGLEEGIERLESEFAGIETPTLAEIYRKQGLFQKALEVYTRLLEKEPDNQEYRAKVEELRNQIEEAADEG